MHLPVSVAMADLKIASMNVRRIGNNKGRETFNWLRNKQQSIILKLKAIDTLKFEWGYKALFRCL